MKNRDVAKIACMLLGLYVTVFALLDIPKVIMGFAWISSATNQRIHAVNLMSALSSWVVFGLELLLGILLWTKSGRIAVWMAPQTSELQPQKQQLLLSDYLYAGFLTIGMYCLVRGLVGLSNLAVLIMVHAQGQDLSPRGTFENPLDWTNACRLVVGIALIFGSRWLLKALKVDAGSIENRSTEEVEA